MTRDHFSPFRLPLSFADFTRGEGPLHDVSLSVGARRPDCPALRAVLENFNGFMEKLLMKYKKSYKQLRKFFCVFLFFHETAIDSENMGTSGFSGAEGTELFLPVTHEILGYSFNLLGTGCTTFCWGGEVRLIYILDGKCRNSWRNKGNLPKSEKREILRKPVENSHLQRFSMSSALKT